MFVCAPLSCALKTGCPKFGHVSSYMYMYILDLLHWLPLHQRILYRINFFSLTIPPWPRSGLSSRHLLHYHRNSVSSLSRLLATERGFLIVLFAHATIKQSPAISVAGLSLWNGLSLALGLFPRIVSNSFLRSAKNFPFVCSLNNYLFCSWAFAVGAFVH